MSTATRAVAVDTAAATLAAAEHLVHSVDRALRGLFSEEPGSAMSYVVSTHVARAPAGHLAAVVSWAGGPERAEVAARVRTEAEELGLSEVDGVLVTDPDLAPVAQAAAAEALRRTAGRLVRYPGRPLVERRITAAAVVAGSCVDAVEGLAGVSVDPDAELDLTGFARPTWRDGRCTLLVQRARDVLVPFELRDQIPCCSGH